jgi:hypothetical protein
MAPKKSPARYTPQMCKYEYLHVTMSMTTAAMVMAGFMANEET